jgi:hypothetical protein
MLYENPTALHFLGYLLENCSSNFVFDGWKPSSTYVQDLFRLRAVEHYRSLYSTAMGRQVLPVGRLFRSVVVELRELRPRQQAVEHLFVWVFDGAQPS